MGLSSVTVEISPGELVDKITILTIKSEKLKNNNKLRNVRFELEKLMSARDRNMRSSKALDLLISQLYQVNAVLWKIEDEIRKCEAASDFGKKFIELARSVYVNNDRRAELKREINQLFGSEIIEEKSYENY